MNRSPTNPSARSDPTDRQSRRSFLKATTAITAATVGGLVPSAATAAESPARAPRTDHGPLIDANVTLSRWPFRRLPLDETPLLVAKLRNHGVRRAWAGTFDALLHKDLGAANTWLGAECRKHGRGILIPFGTVNPTLPDWEEELRRCHEQHEMPGIRLYPNYHGYRLDDPRAARLLALAGQRGLIVQVAVLMEDERTQHPLVRVPYVDLAPLLARLKEEPVQRVVLLNWSRAVKGDLVPKLCAAGQVFFDTATVESVNGVANLLKRVPRERVLFGSHAPFFTLEAAALKLTESELTEADLAAIRSGNARGLLA